MTTSLAPLMAPAPPKESDADQDSARFEILSALAVIADPGGVVELRIPETGRTGTVSGYFDDPTALAQAALRWDGKAPGIYITLNSIDSALLARAANRAKEYAKETTADNHVIRRRWLAIDFDVVRPSGISSTDDEHLAARRRAVEAALWLVGMGFPEDSIIAADSGSGGHDLVRIDLPNDQESTELVQGCLRALDLQFSDAVIHVDQTTWNASRVWKLYGTIASKGDDTVDRHHRRAAITAAPAVVEVAQREALERLAALAPKPEPTPNRNGHRAYAAGDIDVGFWLSEHGIAVSRTGPWDGTGAKFILSSCPMSDEHDQGSAVFRFASGAVGFRCLHDHCKDWRWQDLRARYEQGYVARTGLEPYPGDQALGVSDLDHVDHLGFKIADDSGGLDHLGSGVVHLRDVTPKRLRWLWPGRIPKGKITVVDGQPGQSKSTMMLDIAARITTGSAMPDGAVGDLSGPQNVLILTAEDDLADTVRPRMDAAGADADKVYVWKFVQGEDGGIRMPSLADIEQLTRLARDIQPALIVIDPLMAYLDSNTDSHRDQDVRRILGPLQQLAADTGAAIVVIRHLNKSTGGDPINRGGGSIGIIGAARSGLLVAADPEDPDKRILAPTKSNLAVRAASLAFSVIEQPWQWGQETGTAVLVKWLGAVNITAAQLLALPMDEEEHSALDNAKEVLLQILEAGPKAATIVFREAAAAGVSDPTLRRAKSVLRVTTKKSTGDGPWNWSLPEALQIYTPRNQDDQPQRKKAGSRTQDDQDVKPLGRDHLGVRWTRGRQCRCGGHAFVRPSGTSLDESTCEGCGALVTAS